MAKEKAKWITINPFFPSGIQRVGACYVVKVRGEVVYVGSTSNLASRFWNHRFDIVDAHAEIPWDRRIAYDLRDVVVRAKLSEKYGYWAMLELRLIRKLQPRYNVLGRRRA